jgi:anaerobic magnesium-protoporphyrin IX monomethyl ester cyclase
MKILLTTLHAKYSHASLALPCLASYCQDIPAINIFIREWTVNEPSDHLLRQIMAEKADLVAFSCYIWNIDKSLRIASDIKKIAPDTLIVLGGPEASFGVFKLMHDNPAVDFIVKGEGEAVFRRLLEALVDPGNSSGLEDILQNIDNLFFRDGDDIASGSLSREYLTLDTLPSPFEADLIDLDKPLVYYETSRGCPFSCAFCLSSVEGQVRSFSMERITSDLLFLMRHNAPQIKLVDRTFNYDAKRASRIWEFILGHNKGSHFHFEIAADLLTEENLTLLKLVPQKTFRFEIGVQSTSEETLQRVSRTADLARIFDNIHFLRSETDIELHLDLVAGLPGENYTGFLNSLHQVANLHPHVIQIEPLKVLKGSPMREIARQENYRFSSFPPYTILRTPWLSFEDICRIETVGRLLDLFYNHGGFATTLKLLQQWMTFSDLFDHLARNAGNENLSSLSTRRVYELFARLSAMPAEGTDRQLLHDTLFFDYCSAEMPLMGKLPFFAAQRSNDCAWPGRRELPEGLNLPENSRIKSFRFKFDRDYRDENRGAGPATITFVYTSGVGQGLQILVL